MAADSETNALNFMNRNCLMQWKSRRACRRNIQMWQWERSRPIVPQSRQAVRTVLVCP